MIYYYVKMFGAHHPRLRYAWHQARGHDTARHPSGFLACHTCHLAWPRVT
jgi:hypothetical protein